MSPQDIQEIQEAIAHWVDLARQERRAVRIGIALCPSVNFHRAHTYMRTARSLRIQLVTGVAVCVCCFKPFGVHRLSAEQEAKLKRRISQVSQELVESVAQDSVKLAEYSRQRSAKVGA